MVTTIYSVGDNNLFRQYMYSKVKSVCNTWRIYFLLEHCPVLYLFYLLKEQQAKIAGGKIL